VLDFDATDLRRQPPVDTTWQQVLFCLLAHSYNLQNTDTAPKLWIRVGYVSDTDMYPILCGYVSTEYLKKKKKKNWILGPIRIGHNSPLSDTFWPS
jgi:hypothetical protein